MTRPGGDWLDALSTSPSRPARELAINLKAGKRAAVGDMLMNITATLGWLKDERIRRFTSADVRPLDWAQIRSDHTAVYWSVPLEKQGFLRSLTTAFWNAALYGAQEAGAAAVAATEGAKDEAGGGGAAAAGGRIKFIFDELGNLGKLQDFAQTVTTVAGLGIDLVMNLQSLSQLNAVYGESDARTVFVNCGKVVLGGLTDVDLLGDLVKLLGTTTVREKRVSETRTPLLGAAAGWFFSGGARSVTKTVEEIGVPLMFPEEIAHLPSDEQLVLLPGILPIRQKRFAVSYAPRTSSSSSSKAAGPGGERGEGLGEAISIYGARPDRPH
jgi:type IV secretory pathway TraG/TraD family ATPase VirD4